MQSGAAKAKKYRERADKLRMISVDVRGDADRKYLQDVAADYEQMAKSAASARDAEQNRFGKNSTAAVPKRSGRLRKGYSTRTNAKR